MPALSRVAYTQAYLTRPITMVVPFAAGGPVDTLARLLTERMRPLLGQPIIIENVGGAGGSIGVGRVARATPDGYTLINGIWSTHVVNGAIHPLQYDCAERLRTGRSADQQFADDHRPKEPADERSERIHRLAKANPNKATAGTAGVGSPQHVFGIMFQKATNTHFLLSHYRGGVLATQDLVAASVTLLAKATLFGLTSSGLSRKGGRYFYRCQ